eukprot:gene27369-4671_t
MGTMVPNFKWFQMRPELLSSLEVLASPRPRPQIASPRLQRSESHSLVRLLYQPDPALAYSCPTRDPEVGRETRKLVSSRGWFERQIHSSASCAANVCNGFTLPSRGVREVSLDTPYFDVSPIEPPPRSRTAQHSNSSSSAVVQASGIETIAYLIKLNVEKKEESEATKLFDYTQMELSLGYDYQDLLVATGALVWLIRMISENPGPAKMPGRQDGGPARRAADAIRVLAVENNDVKEATISAGGIAPLVTLLSSRDLKVKRSATAALRFLCSKNTEIKTLIVDSGGLPVILHVLAAGGLQPVISLLRSPCVESQKEAALLLGQFAKEDNPTKAIIGQRGAIPLLVGLIKAGKDSSVQEMAAFALGRLALDQHNQAGIVQCDGLGPLMELLDTMDDRLTHMPPHPYPYPHSTARLALSNAGIVQCDGLGPLMELLETKEDRLTHNASFTLHGLAENSETLPEIVRLGGMHRLNACLDSAVLQNLS